MRLCRVCQSGLKEGYSQCIHCLAWNQVETVTATPGATLTAPLSEYSAEPYQTIRSGPWDCCFSGEEGGLVPTGAVLLGGTAGAGKSTLSLQIANGIAASTGGTVLYLATEEKQQQVYRRAARLNLPHLAQIRTPVENLLSPLSYQEPIRAYFAEVKPKAIFLDSLIGLARHSPHLAVDVCKFLKDLAIEHSISVVIIDHMTKDIDFAGLQTLQHDVDTTMGLLERRDGTRWLRPFKNRFGPTDVECLFHMKASGLEFIPPPPKEEVQGENWEEESDIDWSQSVQGQGVA